MPDKSALIRRAAHRRPAKGRQPAGLKPNRFFHSAARAGNKKIKIHVRAVVKQFVKRHNHLQASIAIDLLNDLFNILQNIKRT
jgi:hypothetical protein